VKPGRRPYKPDWKAALAFARAPLPGSLPSLQVAMPRASDARQACMSLAWGQGRRTERRAQRRLSDGSLHR